jgi:Meiotically up-regulated gene 113
VTWLGLKLDCDEDRTCRALWASSRWEAGDWHGPGTPCERTASYEVADLYLCAHHYKRLLGAIRSDEAAQGQMFDAEIRRRQLALREVAQFPEEVFEAEIRRRLAAREEAREQELRDSGLVYYLRRQDGLIKIGHSARLSQRLATLRAEHGPLDLLLTHPGARDQERQLHTRFAELRVTGEWFRNTREACPLDTGLSA